MKYTLTTRDKNYLLSIGYLPQDMAQIEEGINIGTFTLDKRIKGTTQYTKKEINPAKVIRRVGKKQFLASSGRASFHWTTSDVLKECSENHNYRVAGYDDKCISYDFSKLFK